MVATMDYIVTGLPFTTVILIIGETNYESIAATHWKLSSNSASIKSHLRNNLLGLLQLTVYYDIYNTLSATEFLPPVNPGPSPLIPDGLNDPQISNIHFTFNAKTKLFKDYDLTEKSLKQLLLGAVYDMFVPSLQTKYIGYLNVATCQIIDHLYNHYAKISATDLQENDVALKTAYYSNLPIEALFDQVGNAVDFSADGKIRTIPNKSLPTPTNWFMRPECSPMTENSGNATPKLTRRGNILSVTSTSVIASFVSPKSRLQVPDTITLMPSTRNIWSTPLTT